MQDFDNILLSQLRDIHGLHAISSWPLALGWWLIIFMALSFIAVIIRKLIKISLYRKSWNYELELELNEMIRNPDLQNTKANISRINEILKRLSIQIYGREQSAALSGKKWLAWLSNRDPNNFNWSKKGEILIDHPYMDESKITDAHAQIAILARAVKPWLKI